MTNKFNLRWFGSLGLIYLAMLGTLIGMGAGANSNTVYVDGNNMPGPGNGTLIDPFTSIQDGIDAASEGDTVQVLAGLYIENIVMKSGVDVIGASAELITIIGHDSPSSAVVVFDDVANTKLSGFTITADSSKGMRAVTFVGSATDRTAILERCILIGTQYGIFVWDPSTPTIQNNTLVGRGLNEQGIYIGNGPTSPIVRNNIIVGYRDGIRVVAGDEDPKPIIEYNDLWNSENYIRFPDQTGIAGNISADPLFVDDTNFNLRADSPAIDAGDPTSPLDPDGSTIDMGALPYTHPEN